MSRRTARGDQRRAQADRHRSTGRALQPLQRFEQRLERPGRQWSRQMRPFMRVEARQSLLLIDTLGFIGKQDSIAVESNAQFVGMTFGIDM